MQSVVSAITSTVPISQFNRGLAGKIFEDVRKTGPKVVMKNNEAEVVMLSPQDYVRLMDAVNDAELLSLALERLERLDPAALISGAEMDRRLAFTDGELEAAGEVTFE